MKNFISGIFNKISKCFYTYKDTCRLLEIDLSKQEVKFQIKMKLPILKCSISQAINELNLVEHISAIEACYLGGHYGRIINASKQSDVLKKTNKKMSFLMENSVDRYQILYEDRLGNIGFYDKKLQKEFIKSPLTMANDEKLISQFNSSQACYIGILAGLKLSKRDATKKIISLVKRRPHLKLVT